MKRAKLVAGVFVIVSAMVLAVLGISRRIHTPDHQLALVAAAHDNSDIMLVEVARNLHANLTRSPGEDTLPAWSPDGQQLLFYSERNQRTDLYVMTMDGGAVRRLVSSGGTVAVPGWSPDGQWIAYARIHQPNAGLFIIRPDGTGIHRLTDFPVVTIMWSPDSQHIAFVGNCDGNCDIYVVDVATEQVRQLTHNGLIDAYPVWSPDSQHIAFISNRFTSFEVYQMALDCDETASGGCVAERLTLNLNADSFPDWSPDGTRIAFSSDRSGDYEIYTLEADCYRLTIGCEGQNIRLTYRHSSEIMPIWSPDGEQIAFLVVSYGSGFDIDVLNVADQTIHRMQHGVSRDSTLSWRPHPKN